MKKRLSQVISLTVIAAMLLSMASVTVFANNGYTINTGNGGMLPAGELLFEETFDGTGTYSKTVAGVFGDAGTLGSKEVTMSSGTATEANGAVTFANAGETSKMIIAYKDAETISKLATGTRIVTFNFKVADPNVNVDPLYQSRSVGSTSIGPKVIYHGTNKKLRAYSGSTYKEVAFTAAADTWYTLKVVEDWDNKTYDVYLDRSLEIKGASFMGTAPATPSSHYLYEVAAGKTQQLTIDDFRVYTEPTGRTTYAAENFDKYNAGASLANIPALTARTESTPGSVVEFDGGKAMQVSKGQQIVISGYEYLAGSPTTNATLVPTDRRKLGIAFDFATADVSASVERDITIMTDRNLANPGAKLILKGSDIITYDFEGRVHYVLTNVRPNQKYHIDLYSDITAHTKVSDSEWTCQGTYSVYIDGVCRAEGLRWRFSTVPTTYDDAHNMGVPFAVRLKNVSAATTFTYDNIVIYTDEREEVMEDVMIAVKANAAAVKTGAATFALPASTKAGYTVSWASDSDTIAVDNGTAVVTYPDEAKKVTLTVTVADANNEYAVSRKIWVNLPSKYDTELSAEDGVVTGTVTVNELAAEGYNGGKAILAIYDSSDRLVNVKYINAANGTATVTSDEITKEGNYTAKLFFLNLSNVKPFTKRIQPYSFEVK